MSKKTKDVDEELSKLHVPSHTLPNDDASSNAMRDHFMNAPSANALPPRERIGKGNQPGRGTPGYKTVLEDIERRRGREMRRTLRAAEATRRRQQYRNMALAALLVVALGLAYLLLSRRS